MSSQHAVSAQRAKPLVTAPTVKSKSCSRCLEVKAASEFNINKTTSSGLTSHCKAFPRFLCLDWLHPDCCQLLARELGQYTYADSTLSAPLTLHLPFAAGYARARVSVRCRRSHHWLHAGVHRGGGGGA